MSRNASRRGIISWHLSKNQFPINNGGAGGDTSCFPSNGIGRVEEGLPATSPALPAQPTPPSGAGCPTKCLRHLAKQSTSDSTHTKCCGHCPIRHCSTHHPKHIARLCWTRRAPLPAPPPAQLSAEQSLAFQLVVCLGHLSLRLPRPKLPNPTFGLLHTH